MSLTRKLLLSFGVMLCLVLLLGAAALMVTRDMSRDLERAATVTARQQYLAGEVNAATSELTSLERGGVLAAMLGDKAHVDDYHRRFGTQAGVPAQGAVRVGAIGGDRHGLGADPGAGSAGGAGHPGRSGTEPGHCQSANGPGHGDFRAEGRAAAGGNRQAVERPGGPAVAGSRGGVRRIGDEVGEEHADYHRSAPDRSGCRRRRILVRAQSQPIVARAGPAHGRRSGERVGGGRPGIACQPVAGRRRQPAGCVARGDEFARPRRLPPLPGRTRTTRFRSQV